MNMPIKNMNKGDLVGIILALIFILMFFFVSDKKRKKYLKVVENDINKDLKYEYAN